MEDNFKFLESAIREVHAADDTQESPRREKTSHSLVHILTQRDFVEAISHRLLQTNSKDKQISKTC